MKPARRLLAAALVCAAACSYLPATMAEPQPADPRDPADPHIWLEDHHGEHAMAWVAAENAQTEKRLEASPHYQPFYEQALEIMGAEDRIPAPRFLNGAIYNFWQDETHLRGIWRRTTLDSYRGADTRWETVLDIDALGKAEGKSWVFKGASCYKLKPEMCLVSLSNGGEDAVEVREFSLATGAFVEGGFHLPTSRNVASWIDEDHLLLGSEWSKGDVTESGYPVAVRRLARGQALEDATELYRGEKNDVGVMPEILRDGAGNSVQLITRSTDFFNSQLYVVVGDEARRIAKPGRVSAAALVAGRVVFKLDEAWGGLPAGALADVALDELLETPGSFTPRLVWKPGPREALETVSSTDDHLLLSILDNVNGRLLALTPGPDGWETKPLALPDGLTLAMGSTDDAANRLFASAEGFTTPNTLYLVDAATGQADPVRRLPAKFDASDLVVEQREATSSDGTKIPYFIVRRKTLPLDGSTPVLLNAYGGFQVSMTPSYSATIGKLWLERGGVFAIANIRGGGEFGPAWHEAALKTKRQIAYDDFASVARDLIDGKVTSPEHLGIVGGSNGGLLMGVEMTQFPELYNAVVIQVPLLDMIRISKIAAGASWQGEYGFVYENEDEREFWLRTSPYHALSPQGTYPEPYIFTTTRDDRTGPQHARKFAARMKEYGLPYYYYENTEGGHGTGADIRQSAKTTALWLTYLTEKLMD